MEIMLDTETLSTRKNAAIVAICAKVFFLRETPPASYDPAKSGIFRCAVSAMSCMLHGLHVDPGTVEWWRNQPREAWKQFTSPFDLDVAMTSFVGWVENMEKVYGGPVKVWANSPTFDCEIIRNAGRVVGHEMPWSFRDERDVRTFVEAARLDKAAVPFRGVPHLCNDDVDYQIDVVKAANRVLDEGANAAEFMQKRASFDQQALDRQTMAAIHSDLTSDPV